MIKVVLKIFKTIFIILYPILVFWALSNGYSLKMLSLLFVLAALLQFSSQESKLLRNLILSCTLLLFSGLWIFDNNIFLKLYPVLISISLFLIFSLSLKFPPTMVEKLARLKNKNMPKYAITYCKNVTLIWCGFFLINASVAFFTIFADIKVWTLYNGFISYITVGTIMSLEFLFRTYYIKKKEKK